jgi:hypothetical protein
MKGSVLDWSSSIMEILFENSLITLAISFIFSSIDLLDPEGLACSLKRLVSLFPISVLAFKLPEAIMLDSISTTSSCIQVKVAACLSLKRRAKSGSKAPAKVTLAAGWEGLTSGGILLYSLLNLWINSITVSEFLFFKYTNSVR